MISLLKLIPGLVQLGSWITDQVDRYRARKAAKNEIILAWLQDTLKGIQDDKKRRAMVRKLSPADRNKLRERYTRK